jgi:hypothetical protein
LPLGPAMLQNWCWLLDFVNLKAVFHIVHSHVRCDNFACSTENIHCRANCWVYRIRGTLHWLERDCVTDNVQRYKFFHSYVFVFVEFCTYLLQSLRETGIPGSMCVLFSSTWQMIRFHFVRDYILFLAISAGHQSGFGRLNYTHASCRNHFGLYFTAKQTAIISW